MDYLAHLRADADALLDAAGRDLEARVPACPDWAVGDLVFHIASVHYFWRIVAENGLTEKPGRDDFPDLEDPADAALIGVAREQADALLATLADLDPDRPLWNWTQGPQVAGFVPRRMAQETAVHRVDAQSATGDADPVEPELAADGVDELLSLFLPASGVYDGPEGGRIHLVPSDHDGGWSITLTGPIPPVTRGTSGDPDLVVRGTASDLLLDLWSRRTGATHDGDDAVLDRLRDHLDRD